VQEPGRFVAIDDPRRCNCVNQFANPRHRVLTLFFGHVPPTLVVSLARRQSVARFELCDGSRGALKKWNDFFWACVALEECIHCDLVEIRVSNNRPLFNEICLDKRNNRCLFEGRENAAVAAMIRLPRAPFRISADPFLPAP
jgi:hypothetical protein